MCLFRAPPQVFVTYNPFNVYISQPQVKGGCVLRRANVGLLEREQVRPLYLCDFLSCCNRVRQGATHIWPRPLPVVAYKCVALAFLCPAPSWSRPTTWTSASSA